MCPHSAVIMAGGAGGGVQKPHFTFALCICVLQFLCFKNCCDEWAGRWVWCKIFSGDHTSWNVLINLHVFHMRYVDFCPAHLVGSQKQSCIFIENLKFKFCNSSFLPLLITDISMCMALYSRDWY